MWLTLNKVELLNNTLCLEEHRELNCLIACLSATSCAKVDNTERNEDEKIARGKISRMQSQPIPAAAACLPDFFLGP